ncbi:MAG: hypothetical protein MUC94_15985, partial [bacterium]|nr:hypothetical protein [bacterium]
EEIWQVKTFISGQAFWNRHHPSIYCHQIVLQEHSIIAQPLMAKNDVIRNSMSHIIGMTENKNIRKIFGFIVLQPSLQDYRASCFIISQEKIPGLKVRL